MQTPKNKSNEVLVSDLKQMVGEERKLLTDILHHLKEVEDRRLYLERGYPSLFSFVTEELGYSEAAAQRRVQAMRLMRAVPAVEKKIESGTLSLSVASQVQSFFRLEDKKRSMAQKQALSPSEKLDLVEKLEGRSRRNCEKQLAEMVPEIKRPKEKAHPITKDETLIQFIADKELMEGIDKLKQLLFHSNPEGRLDELFKKLVQLGLEKWDPEERHARREKRQCKTIQPTLPPAEVVKRSRRIPNRIKDAVWQRDKGKCQYQDPVTGRVCGSRHGLQLDHARPFAKGGSHDPANLRLLCRQHNLLVARKAFGNRWMEAKILERSL